MDSPIWGMMMSVGMSSFLETHDLAKRVGANEYYSGWIAQAARGLKPRIDHDLTRP